MRTARAKSPITRASFLLSLVAVLALALGLIAPRAAYAFGTVTVATKEPEEVNGRWKLVFTINYGSAPATPHVPMIFSFTPTVLYERSLTDQSGEKPVLTRIPLQNQQAINESQDVGFADASGKTFTTTKFDFPIRRDRGFEAGEYDLKISRADDGAQVGQVIKLKLKGDNPIVDRRAIVFAGKKKDDKKDEKADEKADEKKAEGEGEAKAETPPADEKPTEAPPPVEPKQGGCGCRLGPEPRLPGAGLALVALGALLALRRRRA
jgi:MYXO-CTERM domain-containing protein